MSVSSELDDSSSESLSSSELDSLSEIFTSSELSSLSDLDHNRLILQQVHDVEEIIKLHPQLMFKSKAILADLAPSPMAPLKMTTNSTMGSNKRVATKMTPPNTKLKLEPDTLVGLGKKAKIEGLEEKIVATSCTHDLTTQEQSLVSQEATTATIQMCGDQQRPLKENSTKLGGPHDEKTSVEDRAGHFRHRERISSQIVRTVKTVTNKIERNGIMETSVERNITIQSDGDPIEHDKAVAEAMQEATSMNLDMCVEKIEIQRQTKIKLLFNKN